jgi:hypothetical protein
MKQMEMDLDRPDVAEAKAKVREMAEQHRAERAAERAKPEPSNRPIPTATDPESPLGPRRSGGGGGGGIPKVGPKKPTDMKKGGYVKAADGIAKRGRTKGRMV